MEVTHVSAGGRCHRIALCITLFFSAVAILFLHPVPSCAASETYIPSADLEATTSLDLWHHSGGYWAVGNAGSDKIIIDDTEM